MIRSYYDPIIEKISIYKMKKEKYIIGFSIYYGDGRVVRSKGTLEELLKAWNNALNENVQVIMLHENEKDGMGRRTRHVLQVADYYSFDGEKFYACNDTRALSGRILYGLWIEDEKFEKIQKQAQQEFLE